MEEKNNPKDEGIIANKPSVDTKHPINSTNVDTQCRHPEQEIKQNVDTQNIIVDTLKQALPKTKRDWIIMFIIVIATIAMGMYILQTYTNLKFQYELLQTPCNLCSALQMNKGSYVGVNWENYNGTITVVQQTANFSSCSDPFNNINLSKIKI